MQYKPQYRTLIKLQEVFAVTKSPNYEPTGLVPLFLPRPPESHPCHPLRQQESRCTTTHEYNRPMLALRGVKETALQVER